jgi:hypothetical protein
MGIFDKFRSIIRTVAGSPAIDGAQEDIRKKMQEQNKELQFRNSGQLTGMAVQPPSDPALGDDNSYGDYPGAEKVANIENYGGTPSYAETRENRMGAMPMPVTPPSQVVAPTTNNLVNTPPPDNPTPMFLGGTTGSYADTVDQNTVVNDRATLPQPLRFANPDTRQRIETINERFRRSRLNPDGTIPDETNVQQITTPVSSTFDPNKVLITIPADPKKPGSTTRTVFVTSEEEAKKLGGTALTQYQTGLTQNQQLQAAGVTTNVNSRDEALKLGGVVGQAEYDRERKVAQAPPLIQTNVIPRPLEKLDASRATFVRNGKPYYATTDKDGKPYVVDQVGKQVDPRSLGATQMYQGQEVMVDDKGNVIDLNGKVVTDLETASQDRNFAYERSLQSIKDRERKARAEGDVQTLANLEVERQRAKLAWLENAPKETKRTFKGILKGIGLGALQGFATGGIGGAIGGAAAGGIGTAISPELGARAQRNFLTLPAARADYQQAAAYAKQVGESEKLRREGVKGELDLRTQTAEAYGKMLESLPFWKQRFGPGGSRRLTQDDINAINARLGFNTGLVVSAGTTDKIRLPNGQQAVIDNDGNVTLANLETDAGKQPIVYEADAERSVNIDGTEVTLNSRDAAKLIGDFAQQNLRIAVDEQKTAQQRELAMLRLGVIGDKARAQNLIRRKKLENATAEQQTSMDQLTEQLGQLTDANEKMLAPVDPNTGEVLINLTEDQLFGARRTEYMRNKNMISRINREIAELLTSINGGKELLQLINTETPEITTISVGPAPRFPRANISVGPPRGQGNISSSRVDSVLRK